MPSVKYLVDDKPVLTLNYTERMKLSNKGSCPNCNGMDFLLLLRELPKSMDPYIRAKMGGKRPVYQCKNCRYWTDWFDGWTWHPEEELAKEIKKVETC